MQSPGFKPQPPPKKSLVNVTCTFGCHLFLFSECLVRFLPLDRQKMYDKYLSNILSSIYIRKKCLKSYPN